MVVKSLKDQDLISYRWLSESTGYSGTKQALQNGQYELYQQLTNNNTVCGLAVDFDVQNPNAPAIGAFTLPANV